jgi:hypothetical protein
MSQRGRLLFRLLILLGIIEQQLLLKAVHLALQRSDS